MAAKGSVNIDQVEVEKVVNRWLVEYYFSLTVELFKNQQYADFCAIRDVLDAVLERPIEPVDDMPLKIRLLQFLSRINEGEKLDSWFEPDQSKTPLESALNLLESMKANFQIPQADFDYVSTLLKEMILGIFIKNEVFDKAKAALSLYFPCPGNDKRATFMSLICQKSKTHKVIDQINFPQFRKEMLCFCQKLCPFTIPFLHKAALSLVESRIEVQHDGAVRSDEQDEDEDSPSSSPQVKNVQVRSRRYPFISKSRLEVAYKALAQCLEEKTFSDLEQEVEEESQKRVCLCLERCTDSIQRTTQSSEQEALFQRKSVSPMEASPADQMTQTDAERQAAAGSLSKTLYTVARFVVEPDSQTSSQCTTTVEELDVETRTTESPQMPSASNKELNGLQCSDSDRKRSRPKRKLPRRGSNTVSRASTSLVECSSDSEGESLQSGKNELEQPNESSSKKANRSSEASESKDEEQAHTNVSKTPKKRPLKWISKSSKNCDPSSGAHVCLSDSSLDMSPDVSSPRPVPQKSSTPHKDAQSKIPVIPLWREGHKNITEEKETWIDEDSFFPSIKNRGSRSNESTISHSGQRRRWTESETENLIQGVKKFGEGNWRKINAYYSFSGRTNVNLKDRWRTMKKQKLV